MGLKLRQNWTAAKISVILLWSLTENQFRETASSYWMTFICRNMIVLIAYFLSTLHPSNIIMQCCQIELSKVGNTECLILFSSNFSEWGNDWNSHPKPYLFPNNHGPHGRYGLVPTQLWYGGRFQMGTEFKLRICPQQLLRMDGNPSKSRLEHSSVLQQSQTRSFRDRMHRRSVISCFVQFSSTQQSIAILLSGTLKSVLPTITRSLFSRNFFSQKKSWKWIDEIFVS